MPRDLVSKPTLPVVLPDEPGQSKDRLPQRSTDKMGLTTRGREIGRVPDAAPGKAPPPVTDKTPQEQPRQPSDQPQYKPGKTPAFAAAYFNKDVEATAGVNQRASNMQALRGAEGVTDLRRVVLPLLGRDSPDPAALRAASERMALTGEPELTDILAQQGSLARGKEMTPEKLLERMRQLAAMIALRVQALARMRQLPESHVQRASTLAHATAMRGAAMEQVQDPVGEGNALIAKSHGHAEGMHRRIAKTLGIKRAAK